MSTTIVRPISMLNPGGSTFQHWANAATGDSSHRHEQVDEAVSDGDTTYYQCATTKHSYEFLGMSDPDLPAGDVISNVRMYFVCRHVTATGYCRTRLNSTSGPTGATKTCTSSFQTFYEDFSVNPITGVAWTEADIYGASCVYFGTEGWASGTKSNCRCTQVYLEITHAPAPSGLKIDGMNATKVNGMTPAKWV